MFLDKQFSRREIVLGFIFILVLQVCLIVFAISKKSFLFMDELWSMNLSNSYFLPLLFDGKDFFNRWLDFDTINKFLSVDPEHRFSYASVWNNQTFDTHPPLYYAYLHTICSFFPGVWGKWIGSLANLPFFIGTQILLFLTARKFAHNGKNEVVFPFIVCILYGFSIGAINTVVIVRMQMMMTFLTTAALYVNLVILDKIVRGEKLFPTLLALIVIYSASFGTQYLDIIPLFFFSAFTLCIILLMHASMGQIILYVLSSFAGVLSLFIYFPAALSHLMGEKGTAAAMHVSSVNIFGSNVLEKIHNFTELLSSNIYVGSYITFICSLFVFLLLTKIILTLVRKDRFLSSISFIEKIREFRPINPIRFNINTTRILFLTFSIFTSIVTIAVLVLFQDERYMMNLFPSTLIVIVYFCFYICSKFKVSTKVVVLVLLGILIYRTGTVLDQNHIKWSGKEYSPVLQLVENRQFPRTMICVSNDPLWWQVVEVLKLYVFSEKTMFSTMNNFQNMTINENSFFLIETLSVRGRIANGSHIRIKDGYDCSEYFDSYFGRGFLCRKE